MEERAVWCVQLYAYFTSVKDYDISSTLNSAGGQNHCV